MRSDSPSALLLSLLVPSSCSYLVPFHLDINICLPRISVPLNLIMMFVSQLGINFFSFNQIQGLEAQAHNGWTTNSL